MKTAEQYLVEQAVAGAVINFLLSAALAWLMYRSVASMPLTGAPSITGNAIVTGFVLPLIVTLIVAPLTRKELAAQRVAPKAAAGVYGWLAISLLPLALVLGLLGALVAALLTIGVSSVLNVGALSFAGFLLFKAAFAAVLGAISAVAAAGRMLSFTG